MNRAFRTVWNESLGAWVAVSELAKRKGRPVRSSVSLAAGSATVFLLAQAPTAWSLPHGAVVQSGQASIGSSSSSMTIQQSSQNLTLNWNSFNVASGEQVNFVQPNSQAVALNRVVGGQASTILGEIHANGQVFLVDPQGVLIGPGAVVSADSFLATTQDIQFNGSHWVLSGTGKGRVVNQGTIRTAKGGTAALVGQLVLNSGQIIAPNGQVILAGGQQVTIDLGQSLQVSVNASTLNTLVENQGAIIANGGSVYLTAGARDTLLSSAVNNSGLIQAQTVSKHNGHIVLQAGMQAGTVEVGGTLDASAPAGGSGGSIETSAAHVHVAQDAVVTTAAAQGTNGTWLIDPMDYSIASSGGDISGTQLSSLLDKNNIVIDSLQGARSNASLDAVYGANGGNIYVQDQVSWSTNNTLKLNAQQSVVFSAKVSNSNGGSLIVHADDQGVGKGSIYNNNGLISLSGGGAVEFYYNPTSYKSPTDFGGLVQVSGATTFTPFMLVNSAANLGAVSSNLSGNYALGKDLDLTNATLSPIGSDTPPFSGMFNGQGFSISNLTMKGTSGGVGYGLFVANTGTLEHLVLNNIKVSSSGYVFTGGLVGVNLGTIDDVQVTGTSSVTMLSTPTDGNWSVGAVAGASGVALTTSTSGGDGDDVTTSVSFGKSGTISNIRVESGVSVSGTDNLGGAIGLLGGGTVSGSYSKAKVTVSANPGDGDGDSDENYQNSAGGFVGWMAGGTVSNSYSAATVVDSYSGYASGFVGVLGSSSGSPTLENVYSVSTLSGSGGSASFYGLGYVNTDSDNDGDAGSPNRDDSASATLTHAYWDSTLAKASGVTLVSDATSAGTAESDAAMQQSSTFAGFDFSQVWSMGGSGYPYPVLDTAAGVVFEHPLTVAHEVASNKTYDGTTTATVSNGSLQGVLSGDTVKITESGTFSQKDVGNNLKVTVNDSISGQSASGYVLVEPSNLSADITPKTLTALGLAAQNKVYDGTTTAQVLGGTLQGVVAGDTVGLSTTGSFAQKDVGQGIAVSVALTNNSKGDYTLQQPSNLAANITPASLQLTGEVAQSKTYDGTTTAQVSGGTLQGVVAGDTVGLSTTGNFAQKDVGQGIGVSVALTNNSKGDYTLQQPTNLAANITPLSLQLTGEVAQNKVYDGNTTAQVSGGTLQGVVAGDTVGLSTTGSFAQKDVGQGIAVSVALTNNSKGDYTLQQPTNLAANITPASLQLTGEVAQNKTYDGTTTAQVSGGTLQGVVAGDTVGLSTTGNFAQKDVGQGIGVSVALTNNSKGDYTLQQPSNLAANITPANLQLTGEVAQNKVYDGNTTAQVSGGTLQGVVAGDTVLLTESGLFQSMNVGSQIPVTAQDKLSGISAANYQLIQPTGLQANIVQLASVTWTGPSLGGLWSNPANWAGGAVPLGSNVANVLIPSGNKVLFDSTVPGPVTLSSLSSGGLSMSSGTLSVSSSAQLDSLTMSQGLLEGSGSLIVHSNLQQTGGQITMSGPIDLSQSSGAMNVGTISTLSSLQIHGTGDVNQLPGSVWQASSGIQVSSTSGQINLNGSLSSNSISFLTPQSISGSGSMNASGSSIVFDQGGSGVYSGTISGQTDLNVLGGGVLTLTGNNTYQGSTNIQDGTLQLGNGATSGTVGTGPIVDQGTLSVNRSDLFVLGNDVSGSGSLTQNGPGTLMLTGKNNYSGSTTIQAGTLQVGQGGTQGSLGTGSVVNQGTLILDRSDSIQLANEMSGSGALTQAGSGTVVITGQNSGTGTTSISSGAIQVGDGGTLGSLGSGAVLDNGVLSFNHADSVNVANPIGGPGQVKQMGTGSLVLTGSNTYSGGTQILSGSVYAGNGQTSGDLGTGLVTDNGLLAINRSDSFVLNNNIQGSGSLLQSGTGTTALTGSNSYTGSTSISAGSLIVGNGGANGSLGSGSVVDQSILGFNQSSQNQVANSITGNGSLVQEGSGTTVLMANNGYSGPTTIAGGTLQIGNGATTGSLGSGSIQNQGTLAFDRSDALVISNPISGKGTIVQMGTGSLELLNAGLFSGKQQVAQGNLVMGQLGTTLPVVAQVQSFSSLSDSSSPVNQSVSSALHPVGDSSQVTVSLEPATPSSSDSSSSATPEQLTVGVGATGVLHIVSTGARMPSY